MAYLESIKHRPKAVNYFGKKLYHRCLTGF